jgi:hypothetical protein
LGILWWSSGLNRVKPDHHRGDAGGSRPFGPGLHVGLDEIGKPVPQSRRHSLHGGPIGHAIAGCYWHPSVIELVLAGAPFQDDLETDRHHGRRRGV